jgi:hypothetical protein
MTDSIIFNSFSEPRSGINTQFHFLNFRYHTLRTDLFFQLIFLLFALPAFGLNILLGDILNFYHFEFLVILLITIFQVLGMFWHVRFLFFLPAEFRHVNLIRSGMSLIKILRGVLLIVFAFFYTLIFLTQSSVEGLNFSLGVILLFYVGFSIFDNFYTDGFLKVAELQTPKKTEEELKASKNPKIRAVSDGD